MATTEQLTTWLTEAETAYHALVTGRSVKVVVDGDGSRVEYTHATAHRLAAYIQELKRLLNQATPGPLKVWF